MPNTSWLSSLSSGFGSVPESIGKSHLHGSQLLTLGGIAAGVGALAAGNAIGNRMAIDASYKKMGQMYPELTREDPHRVGNLFQSIAKASPDVAKDPYVVGSLIKKMLNYDGIDHATYMDLVKTQESISKTRMSNLQPLTSLMQVGSDLGSRLGPVLPPFHR